MELETILQEQTIMKKKFDDALSFQMILFSIKVGGI
jgi:hypothetical protein